NDDSIGTNDDSIGTNDDSIGGVGQLSSGEQARRQQRIKNTETPGYLGSKHGEDNFKVGNRAQLEKAIRNSGLPAEKTRTLISASRHDHAAAGEMASVIDHTQHLPPKDRRMLLNKIAADP